MLTNTITTYGAVTKFFHWSIAVLIIAMIPLGIYANDLPYDTGAALADKAWFFSLHKTIGVAIFFLALARIAWAISQPRPALLNADKPAEAGLATLAHWLLYISLVIVPASGWIHHAATTGFAPIWWPLPQDLPLVPKDDAVAHTFKSLHIIFERVLAVTLILHVAGALKHHIIDRDLTLRRMLPGIAPYIDLPSERAHPKWPLAGALGVFAIALSIGAALGAFSHKAPLALSQRRPWARTSSLPRRTRRPFSPPTSCPMATPTPPMAHSQSKESRRRSTCPFRCKSTATPPRCRAKPGSTAPASTSARPIPTKARWALT